ncbi:nuclear transport factor 2 family protein [Microbacteriaceae bacterium K1510]|nr:nuclear transport factor 2 family protein [Microbacteriaceae bacterium K1510]
MSHAVSREAVEAFFKAYAVRDVVRVAPFLKDDVLWTISGPVDLLPFCGTRRGKAAVIDLLGRTVPSVLRVFKFTTEQLLVDGDRAASLNRLSARRTADGRTISYRVAHFMRFADEKVAENFTFIDSFDAVEQVLGHTSSVYETPSLLGNDVVAL